MLIYISVVYFGMISYGFGYSNCEYIGRVYSTRMRVSAVHTARMADELTQCLGRISSFIVQLEMYRDDEDKNRVEYFSLRIEEYCQLLRVLQGLCRCAYTTCVYIYIPRGNPFLQ